MNLRNVLSAMYVAVLIVCGLPAAIVAQSEIPDASATNKTPTVMLMDGQIVVQGTNSRDNVWVTEVYGQYWVGASATGTRATAAVAKYDITSVEGVVIFGGKGADVINVNGSIPSVIYGGAGNDQIWGGDGDDYIDTGVGTYVLDSKGRQFVGSMDAINARGGNDTIVTSSDFVVVWGGLGDDTYYLDNDSNSIWDTPGGDDTYYAVSETGTNTVYDFAGDDEFIGFDDHDFVLDQ